MKKESTNIRKEYKYDVAFSLCKEDVDFARKLVKELNPNLKVFFYETRQEELISKSGPEEFSRIFKDESRIVVILSRNAWSTTFYTELERNAIVDRTSVKNEGYGFLFVVPMLLGEIPHWYPSTNIYVDPRQFSIKDIGKFIEFKVSEYGGIVKPLNAIEHYQFLEGKINEKIKLVELQQQKSSIESAYLEIEKVKSAWKSKVNALPNLILREIGTGTNAQLPFTEIIRSNWYQLKLEVFIPQKHELRDDSSCQDFQLIFSLLRLNNFKERDDTIKSTKYTFYYQPPLMAWGIPSEEKRGMSVQESKIYFKSKLHSYPFDIENPIPFEELLNQWFIEFIDATYEEITPHI